MRLDQYIASKSSLSFRELFHHTTGAVRLGVDARGRQTIVRWDAARVGFPQPSADEVARVAAMPDLVTKAQAGQECSRRIFAVASQLSQINMASYMATSSVTDQDRAAFSSWLGWVQAMRQRCSELAGTSDSAYTLDTSWPACPADARALAERF